MRCGAESESINHTLFECPPALQVWAHSLIPSPPGRFPCSSLFGNFDYLLLRAKKQGLNGAVMTPIPWILWYIWKARKEKVFNNKDIFPLETLQLAVKEAESWNLAQRVEAIEDPSQKDPPTSGRTMQTTETTPFQWRCQSDASWTSNKDRAGLGFVLLNTGSPTLFGVSGIQQVSTPLHAEAEGLIWAMEEVQKTGKRGVRFELDCEQLVKLINKEEDWPSLAAELDEIKALSSTYLKVSIIHIPRSLNVRADCLAKGGRSRVLNHPFVESSAPRWLDVPAG